MEAIVDLHLFGLACVMVNVLDFVDVKFKYSNCPAYKTFFGDLTMNFNLKTAKISLNNLIS